MHRKMAMMESQFNRLTEQIPARLLKQDSELFSVKRCGFVLE